MYGIPEFRLPKLDVVAKEVENVKSLGVKIETNVIIGKSVKIDELLDEEGFEAVFIGSGAGLPMFMGIPGETAKGVFSANEFLTRNNLMKAFRDDYDTPIVHGKKVVLSAAEMWQWMQLEQLFVSALKYISYTAVVKQSFRHVQKKYIMQRKRASSSIC